MYRLLVFSALIRDSDRNPGKLISEEWKVWIIDFTRAFRLAPELQTRDGLRRCDRNLLAKLRRGPAPLADPDEFNRYYGHGWASVLMQFVPKLRVAGVPEETIRMILVDNPRRFLVSVPKA